MKTNTTISQPRPRKAKKYRYALNEPSAEFQQAMELMDMADAPDGDRAKYQRDFAGPLDIPVSISRNSEK